MSNPDKAIGAAPSLPSSSPHPHIHTLSLSRPPVPEPGFPTARHALILPVERPPTLTTLSTDCAGHEGKPFPVSWNTRDLLLYAVGVRALPFE